MEPLIQSLSGICERHGVADLYAFGSRAREISGCVKGEEAQCGPPDSDVDIGVRFLPDAAAALGGGATARLPDERCALHNLDARLTLAWELEDLLGARPVDLVDVAHAEAFVAADIVRGELLYCTDPADQAEFELYVLRRAGDLAWYKRREIRHQLHGEPL